MSKALQHTQLLLDGESGRVMLVEKYPKTGNHKAVKEVTAQYLSILLMIGKKHVGMPYNARITKPLNVDFPLKTDQGGVVISLTITPELETDDAGNVIEDAEVVAEPEAETTDKTEG